MNTQPIRREPRCSCCFFKANEAVSSLEYAFLIGIVTVAVGAAIVTFGGDLKTTLETMAAEIPNITIESTKEFKATP